MQVKPANSRASANNSSPTSFGISHYAGKVKYDARHLVDLSKDHISRSLVECLQRSDEPFVAYLFASLPAPNGSYANMRSAAARSLLASSTKQQATPGTTAAGNNKAQGSERSLALATKHLERLRAAPGSSSSSANLRYADHTSLNASHLVHFGVALNELIGKLEQARPVFVRCLKPNENSFSNQFVANIAIKQVRESGMVEYARVRKFNYAHKIDFALFVRHFDRLVASFGFGLVRTPFLIEKKTYKCRSKLLVVRTKIKLKPVLVT